MNTSNFSQLVKVTSYLIAAAIIAPAALLLGASVAAVASATTLIGVAAIALNDYSRNTVDYDRVAANRTERHPLAA